jgi:hypothetical protein
VKFAVTVRFPVMFTMHVFPLALSHPLQPENCHPGAGLAVSVTCVPALKLAEQLVPQSIPEGLLVTVPPAAAFLFTVSE